MDDAKIFQGDALQVLRTLASGSVHCVVTSPPYFGLRDYGTATWMGGDAACDHKSGRFERGGLSGKQATNRGSGGDEATNICGKCGAVRQDHQLGLERTPGEYVGRLVEVFREVRRVMRPDATLWLNLGDSYASGKGTCYNPGGGDDSLGQNRKDAGAHPLDRGSVSELRTAGLKPKDLVGIPWRVAFALQSDGWWLRSEIIWEKRAPMPESVTDRPTRSHEQVFLLSKSARYFYDAEAIKEPAQDRPLDSWEKRKAAGASSGSPINGHNSSISKGIGFSHNLGDGAGRNQRDVWTLGPEPCPEAHFAVFPSEIPRRAILAGTSARGCCPGCGAPWKRVVEKSGQQPGRERNRGGRTDGYTLPAQWKDGQNPTVTTTAGWRPTCDCPLSDPIPCTVLDPFLGSGTTLAVAVELGQRGVGIELNERYIKLAHERIGKVQRPLMTF